jgi:hypothetical protein
VLLLVLGALSLPAAPFFVPLFAAHMAAGLGCWWMGNAVLQPFKPPRLDGGVSSR